MTMTFWVTMMGWVDVTGGDLVTIVARSLACVLGWVGGVASASEWNPSSAVTPCVV